MNTTTAAKALNDLRRRLGAEQVLLDPAECWAYGQDNSRRHALPVAVALPTDHAQVVDVVRWCKEQGLPLTTRGRGTGTTGGSVPTAGGVVLSCERMTQIKHVDAANRLMIVEPGVTNQAVQEAAARHGFFWPPDPTSAAYCTVGGNLAFNSAGPRAVKYGTPRENTLGLRAVTGAGASLRTGVKTTKGVVGYDLTRLLIGSEGTLAIITEATLKLTPLPAAKATLQACYHSIAAAADAVQRIMSQPVIPCALEFMDHQALQLARKNGADAIPSAAQALLMIEVDGPRECLTDSIAALRAAAAGAGLLSWAAAQTPDEVRTLWQARKALSPALRDIAPKKINEDVVVPVARMAELVTTLEEFSRRYDIPIVNFGHAGNGNIHVNLLVNPDDGRQMQRAEDCLQEIFRLVLQMQGSLSGEHGVGLEKRRFVAWELDPVALALMDGIKAQFDPAGILNPGKTLPGAPA